MPFSHHSHSGQFCNHASNTLAEMVEEAGRQEMRVFALTEHMPRDRIEDLYSEEVRRLDLPFIVMHLVLFWINYIVRLSQRL
jgi:histidinol-phosphatase (PHP family)